MCQNDLAASHEYSYLDNRYREYEFDACEHPDGCQLKPHHTRGDERSEVTWKDNGNESLDGHKHDCVDAEVERQVANDGVERAQAGRPHVNVQLLSYPHGHETTHDDIA